MNTVEAVFAEGQRYLQHNWPLVPIPSNRKGPSLKGWNRRENCVTDGDQLAAYIKKGFLNLGLAHAYSGTCAVDIDHIEAAALVLETWGVDLNNLLDADDAVLIESGRGNRGKLLYRIDAPLVSKKIKRDIDGVTTDIIDFRCQTRDGLTVQDVLPPSIHPDTGNPYRWGGAGDFNELPTLPDSLKAVWLSLIQQQDVQAQTAAPSVVGHISDILQLDVSPHTNALLTQGKPKGQRSEAVLGAAKDLLRAGATDQLVKEVLTDPRLGISACALERGYGDIERARQWLTGTLKRAHKDLAEERMREGIPVKVRSKKGTEVDFTVADTFAEIDADAIGNNTAAKPQRKFHLKRAGDIEPQAIAFAVDGYLEAGAIHCLFGDPESLKTFTALDMGLSIAAGIPWHTFSTTQGAVVYICGEGERGIGRRIQGWCQARGIDRKSLDFYISTVPANFQDPTSRQQLIEALQSDMHGLTPTLIIIDTIARNIGGSEDSNDDINQLFGLIDQEIRADNPCTVILVGHPGHSDKTRPRGGSALLGNIDSSARMKAGPDLTTTYEPQKMKDGPRPEPLTLQGVEVSVRLGVDEGTTLVLQPAADSALPAGDARKPATANQKTTMKAFMDAAEGQPVHIDVFRTAFYRISTADNDDSKRKAFNRGRESLVDTGVLRVENDVYSRTGYFPVSGLAGEIIVRVKP